MQNVYFIEMWGTHEMKNEREKAQKDENLFRFHLIKLKKRDEFFVCMNLNADILLCLALFWYNSFHTQIIMTEPIITSPGVDQTHILPSTQFFFYISGWISHFYGMQNRDHFFIVIVHLKYLSFFLSDNKTWWYADGFN